MSHKALGLPRRGGAVDLWEGVPTFDSFEVAADRARRYKQGDYLARLAIEPDGPIRWRQTGSSGHHTLWGTPAELQARVVEIVPLPPVSDERQL
jgi:hypothetical protein